MTENRFNPRLSRFNNHRNETGPKTPAEFPLSNWQHRSARSDALILLSNRYRSP
jgi:hypothetical protein